MSRRAKAVIVVESLVDLLVMAVLGGAVLLFGGVSTLHASVLQLAMVGTMGLFVIGRLLSDEPVLVSPEWLLGGLFVAFAWWRYLGSGVEYLARSECLWLAYGWAWYLVVYNSFRTRDSLRQVMLLLVMLATGLGLYGCFQFFTSSDQVLWLTKPTQYGRRATGTFGNPNHYCCLLGMLAPMLSAAALVGKWGWGLRIVFGYGSLAAVAGICVSGSRGGYLAVAVSSLVLAYLLLRGRRRGVQLICLLVMVLTLAGIASWVAGAGALRERIERLSRVTQGADPEVRLELWRVAVMLWSEAPYTGVGPNQFNVRYPVWRQGMHQRQPQRTHNDYLNVLVDYGLVGVGLLALPVMAAVGRMLKAIQAGRPEGAIEGRSSRNRHAWVIGAASGVTALGVHSVFDFNAYIPAIFLMALTLTALAVRSSAAMEPTGSRYGILDRGWKAALLVALATLPALSGYASGVRLRTELIVRQVDTRTAGYERILEVFERAAALDPGNPQLHYTLGETCRAAGIAADLSAESDRYFERAITHFDRTIRLHPRHAHAWGRRGICLHFLAREAEAQASLLEAARHDPVSANVLFLRGWYALEMGRLGEAHTFLLLAGKYGWEDSERIKFYQEKLWEMRARAEAVR